MLATKSPLSEVVKASRNALVIRYILMALHLIFDFATFIVTLLSTATTPLLVPQSVSIIALLLYIPVALFLSIRPSSIAFDAARIEVAYLGLQAALGMITMGIGISLLAGPACHKSFIVDYLPMTKAACEIFIGTTILNVSHCITSITWLIWLLNLVHSNDFAGRRPWRMSVARMLRARSEDSARVTLDENGRIVDSGGIWQMVNDGSGPGAEGVDREPGEVEWGEIHAQTPLLAGGSWGRGEEKDEEGSDDGADTATLKSTPPPRYQEK